MTDAKFELMAKVILFNNKGHILWSIFRDILQPLIKISRILWPIFQVILQPSIFDAKKKIILFSDVLKHLRKYIFLKVELPWLKKLFMS